MLTLKRAVMAARVALDIDHLSGIRGERARMPRWNESDEKLLILHRILASSNSSHDISSYDGQDSQVQFACEIKLDSNQL